MRIPESAHWPLLAIAFVALVLAVLHDPVFAGSKEPDYCALANMRQCKIQERGEWVLVTGPDGSQHMIFMQNGKVLQVN